MSRLLIAGCGYLGKTFLATLGPDQHVIAVNRSPHTFPVAVDAIQCDLARDNLQLVPKQVDTVVYAVAAKEHTESAYEMAYHHALHQLLKHLDLGALKQFVFISSTGVYTENQGAWVTESSATGGTVFSGRIMREAESLLLSYLPGAIILRLGGIYGPERTRFIRRVLRGEVPMSDHVHYTNRVHVEDAARAIAHVLKLSHPHNIYNVVDNMPAPRNEVIAWLCQHLDNPAPTQSRHFPGANKRVSNARLLESGFELLYPDYRIGYLPLLRCL